MNFSESFPAATRNNSPSVRRKIALAMLALFFLSAVGVLSLVGNPADVPSVSAGMGPCTADFTVVDAANKAVYGAKVHAKVKYGFMSKNDADLEVGTNSDGKARIEGLPVKLKKPPMQFTITSGDLTKSVENDPAADCHPTFPITLGK